MHQIAVIQLSSTADVKENLNNLLPYFDKANQEGVELLLLPENFAFMGKQEEDKCRIAEVDGDGLIQNHIKELASRYNVWVIAGTMPIKTPDSTKVFARSMVYNNKGERVDFYDKIHLFDVRVSEHEAHEESRSIEAGKRCVVVDTPVGKVGLTVCYDVRFPELYRQLVDMGATTLVVPSAFTATTGSAHWEVLLRARAIENLCYVAAANQVGQHASGRITYGHSMVIEPWGQPMKRCMEAKPSMAIASIDLKRLHELRKQFPCNEHHVLT